MRPTVASEGQVGIDASTDHDSIPGVQSVSANWDWDLATAIDDDVVDGLATGGLRQ